MIHPQLASAMLPILEGVLHGYITEITPAPKSEKICAYSQGAASAKSKQPSGADKIFVMNIVGTMLKYDSCGTPGAKSLAKQLTDADADPEIIGHIIRIDSGGGSCDAVPVLANAINSCKKPVVAYVDGMAASAAIYVASYCSRIIASDDYDSVGCIGTLIELSGYSQYHKDEDGYITARIYADQSYEKNLEYEEALKGNSKIIKEEVLNPYAEKFMKDMQANRPGVQDNQLHGKTFWAKDSIGSLIDSIGPFEDAINAVLMLANSKTDESVTENQSNRTNMEKYEHLNGLESMKDQVYDADGSTVLQPVQLDEIEARLQAADNMQHTIDALSQDNSRFNAENTELSEKLKKAESTISKLQESLDAAIAKLDDNSAPGVVVKKDAATSAVDKDDAAKTYEEADKACRDFLAMKNNQ